MFLLLYITHQHYSNIKINFNSDFTQRNKKLNKILKEYIKNTNVNYNINRNVQIFCLNKLVDTNKIFRDLKTNRVEVNLDVMVKFVGKKKIDDIK